MVKMYHILLPTGSQQFKSDYRAPINMTEKKKSAGRPKKYNLDTKQVIQLAGYGCTNTEMASFFGCSETTLTRNYVEYLTKGRDEGKIRLRQLQW